MIAQSDPVVERLDGHIPHRWDDAPEEPPMRGAPAVEVVPFLEDIAANYFYDNGWAMSQAEQRRVMRLICEGGDPNNPKWSWPQVSRLMRQTRTAAVIGARTEEHVTLTERGVAVFHDRFVEPRPICPFKRRWFDMRHFIAGARDKDCGSPVCERCGPQVVDGDLERIESRIAPLDAVYIARLQWFDGLGLRMSQRRFQTGLRTVTYRDVTGLVTIVGDRPIEGQRPKKDPKSSEKMAPPEALELLVDSLWIPGRVSLDFSERWAFGASEKATGDPAIISLDGLDDDQVLEFKERAVAIVRDDYGHDLVDGEVPGKFWSALKKDLTGVKREILARR
jgi:hypothetical protein